MSPLPFAERASPNPFGPRVGQPLDHNQVDVTEINFEAFEACRRLLKDVAEGGFSAALTVFGDSGTGKTHLIGRVRRWLEPQTGNLFVFVRMGNLAGGHLEAFAPLPGGFIVGHEFGRCSSLNRLLEHRKRSGMLANRDLSVGLLHLLEGRQIRDSAAWLRGEGLPDEVLNSLRLSSPGPDDDPEVTSRYVVMALCELIRPGVVVFCMDQIEAVMSSAGDRDGPHAFGRLVSCLVDETRNAGVICCEQSSFKILMEQILDEAARSRALGRRAAILPLSWEQAQRLIAARLATVPELAAERTTHGGCWPLAESEIRKVFVANAAPARTIIARCKDLFDLWRSGQALVVEPLDAVLQKMLDERFTTHDPAETETILRNGIPY